MTTPNDVRRAALLVEAIATDLDALMQRHGISERELCRRTGVHYNVINRTLRARTMPRLATLTRLFGAFGHQIQVVITPAITTSGSNSLR